MKNKIKKILYIANARIPTEKAHGVQIMKMCEAFKNAGVDIELIVPNRHTERDPFEFYGIKNRFPIKRLPIIDSYNIGSWGFILGSFSFAVTSFFYALFKRGDFIIYSRDMDQFSFFTVPFIGRSYFFEIHGPKEKGLLYNFLFKRISGVVATNRFNGEKIVKNFNNMKDRVIVQPNGVDIEKFTSIDKSSAREKLGLPQDKKIVVYAGHFYKWKGIEALIKAGGKLSEDTLIYLVGGTENDIERIKKGQDIPPNVLFAGFRDYKEIPYWYSSADLLVLTGTGKDSYSLRHTSPIKLREYMASGRLIIAVDTPSIRDAVTDKEVFFYKPDSADDLGIKINEVLASPDVAVQKAQAAQVEAKNYSWSRRVKEILEFVDNKTWQDL